LGFAQLCAAWEDERTTEEDRRRFLERHGLVKAAAVEKPARPAKKVRRAAPIVIANGDDVSVVSRRHWDALVDGIVAEVGGSRSEIAVKLERGLGRQDALLRKVFLGHDATKLGLTCEDLEAVRSKWRAILKPPVIAIHDARPAACNAISVV
jgi:hypothetical protein